MLEGFDLCKTVNVDVGAYNYDFTSYETNQLYAVSKVFHPVEYTDSHTKIHSTAWGGDCWLEQRADLVRF